jgi:hypothetical protein
MGSGESLTFQSCPLNPPRLSFVLGCQSNPTAAAAAAATAATTTTPNANQVRTILRRLLLLSAKAPRCIFTIHATYLKRRDDGTTGRRLTVPNFAFLPDPSSSEVLRL